MLTIVMLIAIVAMLLGWVFFRLPGISFWARNASVWKADDHLNPVGAKLWLIGFVIGMLAWIPWAIIQFIQL